MLQIQAQAEKNGAKLSSSRWLSAILFQYVIEEVLHRLAPATVHVYSLT